MDQYAVYDSLQYTLKYGLNGVAIAISNHFNAREMAPKLKRFFKYIKVS